LKLTECRSCGEPIFWTETVNGKRMPMDAEPDPLGKFVLEDEGGETPTAVYSPFESGDRYASHFASCPDALRWRED
jgi:hypothetical protein